MNSRNQSIGKQLVFLIIFFFMSQASISFSGNSTVKAMDSGTIHYPTPTFYSLVLALFLITLIVSFILPCITFLLKAPVRFLKAPARFLKAPLRFMHHTVASPSGHLGLDSQPIENYISLDIDSLISSISYVQDQTLHNVKTSNTFPIWFQDDYLSLSRCNDYHTKINSVEGSASVLIFAYQGYMIVKRCRETGSSSAGKGRLNHENRIVEQPREFGFKGVKLGSFGTCSHKTPKIQTGYLDLDFQPIEHHISLDIDSLISSVSYVQDQTLHTVKTNTFPTWFQDDYLSLSRCNDYHKKINSLEDSVIIFAYQGYMIVKRCRETREIDSSSAEENLENRIAEQPREFGFKEVKLGSFGTSSYNTPKIQTATVGTGNHKRDFKVKSLKVAHAARLLEEEKETLRRLRKEAYQIELAKVKKENKIKMQGSFIKKMEELKKKQERRLLVVEQVRKQKLKFDYKFDENLKGTSISPPYKYSPNWNKYVPSLASEDNVAMVLPMERKNNHELIFCANSFCTMDAGNHKRDFKVKSLKAAGAARLCEQEKENLRRQRKKAYQIEIANARRENEIKMQGEFIKKMGELKKKQERRLLVAAPVQKQKLKKDFKHDANIKGTSIPPPYEYPPIRKKSVPSWASEDCLAMVIPLQQKINPESIFGPNSFCTVDEVLLPWESKNHAYDDD